MKSRVFFERYRFKEVKGFPQILEFEFSEMSYAVMDSWVDALHDSFPMARSFHIRMDHEAYYKIREWLCTTNMYAIAQQLRIDGTEFSYGGFIFGLEQVDPYSHEGTKIKRCNAFIYPAPYSTSNFTNTSFRKPSHVTCFRVRP